MLTLNLLLAVLKNKNISPVIKFVTVIISIISYNALATYTVDLGLYLI